jgi:AraC family transcriptional regulator of adaptative response / DNA-3-methyladenine glycosylase II
LTESSSGLYAAFVAKDARFDGRFLVAISTTGIYCRPVCRARQPKAQNCAFYNTAAQAEQAGYRPCLLCRPELAPGSSKTDATAGLAQRAARMLEASCASGQSLEEMAQRLGCTGRHLRRAFAEQYGVSPVQYIQTCRLLLAKSLLTDTNLSVLEVAMSAGFGSLRRFNDLFKKRYRLSPTALRRKTTQDEKRKGNQGEVVKTGKMGSVNLLLGYRPPYLFDEMLSFLAARAMPGVEVVRGNEYLRTVRLLSPRGEVLCGWIRVKNESQKNALSVRLSESLLPALPQLLAKVRRLFDLNCEPHGIYETLRSMNDIRPGLCVLGVRVPGSFDSFEMAVRAVLGQQISVKAASTLAGRIVSAHGRPVQTGIEGLTHVFPGPDEMLSLQGPMESHLGPLGVTAARARTIKELSMAFAQGDIEFDLPARPEEEMKKLMAISGIGSWTAKYIAMRAMEWPDAFLETDAGIKKALKPNTSKEMIEMAQAWRPWRSYATVNLWNSL